MNTAEELRKNLEKVWSDVPTLDENPKAVIVP